MEEETPETAHPQANHVVCYTRTTFGFAASKSRPKQPSKPIVLDLAQANKKTGRLGDSTDRCFPVRHGESVKQLRQAQRRTLTAGGYESEVVEQRAERVLGAAWNANLRATHPSALSLVGGLKRIADGPHTRQSIRSPWKRLPKRVCLRRQGQGKQQHPVHTTLRTQRGVSSASDHQTRTLFEAAVKPPDAAADAA